MSLVGSLFSINTAPCQDPELARLLNEVLKHVKEGNQKMANIHDDIQALKAEVVSLNTTVATGIANIAANLTTSAEAADVENAVAQLKQIENAVNQATAIIVTPPPVTTEPPVTTTPPPPPVTTIPPVDAPPTTPSDPGAPPPPAGDPPPLVDPAVAAAIRKL